MPGSDERRDWMVTSALHSANERVLGQMGPILISGHLSADSWRLAEVIAWQKRAFSVLDCNV